MKKNSHDAKQTGIPELLRRILCAALALILLALPALAASEEVGEGFIGTSNSEIDGSLAGDEWTADETLNVAGEVTDLAEEEAALAGEEELTVPSGQGASDLTDAADAGSDPQNEDSLAEGGDSENAPAAEGEDTPAAEGEEKPAAEGEDTPAAEGEDTPAAEGEEKPAAEGEDTPAAEGEDTPAVEGEETPAAEGEEKPTAEGEDTPAAEGEDTPTAEGDGEPAAEGAEDTADGENEGADAEDAAEANEAPEPVPPRISAPGGLTMGLKESRALGATLTGDAEGLWLSYRTSNPKVVVVGANGQLTAKKKGKATITIVASNGLTATCSVKVVKAPKKLKLNAGSVTLGYDAALGTGTRARLAGSLTKGSASAIYWYGYNSNIVNVAADGTLTAVGVGRTTVTARTFNNKRASCVVTVLPGLETLTLNAEQFEVGQNCVGQLCAANASGRFPGLSFISGNPDIATVDGAGRVRGVAPGEAVITATSFNGLTAQSKVTVLPGPTGISVRGTTITMGIKEKLWLNAVPVRSDGQRTATTFYYSTSKKKVVSVNGAGMLTAKRKGKARITVTAANGVRVVCTIKVVKAPKKVWLNTGSMTLYCDPIQGVNTSGRLYASITRGRGSSISWVGYNPAIVSVAANGTVTAKGVGTTRVTARTFNGKTASCTVTVRRVPEQGELQVQDSLSLWRGQGAQLYPSFLNGTASPLRYSVDDPSVAVVDAAGRIITKAVGTAKVTAHAINDVSASCTVVVTPYRDTHPLATVAHRGGAGYWPENTLEAFSNLKARFPDVDGVELDVRTTKDGVQVVHHDAFITANDKNYQINKYKYSQLRNLKPSLCTLDQALAVIARTDLTLQLELKDTANAAKCVAAVKSSGMRSRTMYISFYDKQLSAVRKADGGAKLGYITGNGAADWARVHASVRLSAVSANCGSMPSQSVIDECHRNGLLVCAWTVDDEDTARRVAAMDVDMICGNYPDRIMVE